VAGTSLERLQLQNVVVVDDVRVVMKATSDGHPTITKARDVSSSSGTNTDHQLTEQRSNIGLDRRLRPGAAARTASLVTRHFVVAIYTQGHHECKHDVVSIVLCDYMCM